MKTFDEAELERAILSLLKTQGYPHTLGSDLSRAPDAVILEGDLRAFLAARYRGEKITGGEIHGVIRQIISLSAQDLYGSNKTFCKWLSDGFPLKREDPHEKDLFIRLVDFSPLGASASAPLREEPAMDRVAEAVLPFPFEANIYRLVSQMEIEGRETSRIPDAILFVNGLPLVVFEFKSAIREEAANLGDAYTQLTTRYRRDIPKLFVTNAFCVISDGVQTKMGTLFSPYEFFYAWRKVTGEERGDAENIDSLHAMVQGLFHKARLLRVLRDFLFFPDKSNEEKKIVCRYPQFYAVEKLFQNILLHQKPHGDGKGGTYFGATGCGKSYTMQFLARRLMKSKKFESPTLVFITDRTDLDDQLSGQILNAKEYIGDYQIESVISRDHLRELLQGRKSGGVFLTTIHKFTEDTELLTERTNVICISDEAHRSQVNLDQKIQINEKTGTVSKRYGFAKYLHDSLPHATYVGFTGTPIDATLDVFGDLVESYTMNESVVDEITVRIVYEGRAAKVLLEGSGLEAIEAYYRECEEAGSSEYQVEESKKSMSRMGSILGEPDRLTAVAKDFVAHYESRIDEGATLLGKALFVSSSREIAWLFYQALRKLRPAWFEVKPCEEGVTLTDAEKKTLTPTERVKLVMTRNKDDEKALFDLVGNKDDRKELDRQFKNEKSNFKIAIVVDMWLTGFDVPALDTIYIDKPIQKHSLIQTISRVNRKYEGKEKGLVVDYIGIKKQMTQALAHFNRMDGTNFEEIGESVSAVKDFLDLLGKMFHNVDLRDYFADDATARLACLKHAAEFVLQTEKHKKRFMALVKRLKAAYDVCCGSDRISEGERDGIHFYLAVRSIVYKMTHGEAPDTTQMNERVRMLIDDAIQSDGVEELFLLGEDAASEIDLFDADYLALLGKIRLPHTKIQLLQKLLKKAIADFKKTNKAKGIDFTERFEALVKKYNERKEEDAFTREVHEEAIDGMFDLIDALKEEMGSFEDLGITLEEKAFFDILKKVALKYAFAHGDEALLELARQVKEVVADTTRYPDWNNRSDIKAKLRVGLIVLLSKNGYPPVSHSEVYRDVFEQAEHFKQCQGA